MSTKMRMFPCIVTVLIASAALAQDQWSITTSDFATQRAALRGLDDSGVAVESSPDQRRTIELDRLLSMERISRVDQAAEPARFLVILANQDRIAGQPAGLEGENLIWETPSLGRMTLPLRTVSSIVRAGREPAPPGKNPQTEDIATLINGDSVRGIVSAMEAATVTVQQPGGEKTPVPLDSMMRLMFASIGGAVKAPARGFRVGLADGTAITAARLRLTNQSLALMFVDGTARAVDLSAVASIEQIHGPVVWLSSLVPVETAQTSLLDLTWPPRMDRSVDGTPIRFGDRTYARGIGVHAYSRIAYAIDPSARAFRTQYAIPGDAPWADVTVRIKLDGQVVHEKAEFRAGVLSKPVVIDVSGKKQLILEVDYGQNYDVQDRFNWIEPAFLNFVPEKR